MTEKCVRGRGAVMGLQVKAARMAHLKVTVDGYCVAALHTYQGPRLRPLSMDPLARSLTSIASGNKYPLGSTSGLLLLRVGQAHRRPVCGGPRADRGVAALRLLRGLRDRVPQDP